MEILQFIGIILLGVLAFWKLLDLYLARIREVKQASVLLSVMLYAISQGKPLDIESAEELMKNLADFLNQLNSWSRENADVVVTIVRAHPNIRKGLSDLMNV